VVLALDVALVDAKVSPGTVAVVVPDVDAVVL
jgi:hypothetical protein